MTGFMCRGKLRRFGEFLLSDDVYCAQSTEPSRNVTFSGNTRRASSRKA